MVTDPAGMSGTPSATRAITPQARERGWRGVFAAAIALALLPTIPQVRLLLPVDQTLLLVAPALGACAVAAWWRGGRAVGAFIWTALAVWIVAAPPAQLNAFGTLERAWCVLLAASFGLVHVLAPSRRLLSRALAAIALTSVSALVITALVPDGFSQLHSAVTAEIDGRLDASINLLANAMQMPQWQRLAESSPAFARLAEESTGQLQEFAQVAARLYPAVVALESLMALALTWALFHRISRTRIGPALMPLREFRFNDQLVWGLVVGIVLLVLPSFSGLRDVGLNLLFFFGALYALRGFGVLAWYFASHRVG
ncbi:MAG: DUF2232 domain-containing protein, partial [Gemmatimonadaceae bacterium]